MAYKSISLKQAVDFHGHLGPYLVLGLLMGRYALSHLRCKKYFGLEVKVYGASQKPKSCLIDGLQMSTGATYGKGNIQQLKASVISVLFSDKNAKNSIRLSLKKDLNDRLNSLKSHKDSEDFARKLYHSAPIRLFNLMAY